MKRLIYWLAGIFSAIGLIVAYEAFWAALVKYAGFYKTTLVRFVITLAASWIVIYYASRSKKNIRFQRWLSEREASMSRRAQKLIKGGKFIAVVNTAVFLGPILASILMMVFGIGLRRLYFYAVICSLLAAGVWCGLYSGMFWGIEKVLVRK